MEKEMRKTKSEWIKMLCAGQRERSDTFLVIALETG